MNGAEEHILIRVLRAGLFPQDDSHDLRERYTAGDRCEPLGSDGMWTKRGPATTVASLHDWGRLPLASSGSGDPGVCLSGDNDAVRDLSDEEEHWVSYEGCSEAASSSLTDPPPGARTIGPPGCAMA
jgi:hypothetical protein